MTKLSSTQILERLVAMPTVSRDSNLPLVGWVRDYLDGFGIRSAYVANDEGTKANLIASVGPERTGGLALSGHTDVVPVDDQDWRSDPFRLTEREGRLHARGSADMKGFIACAIAALTRLNGRRLERPATLLLSYDEEVGCLGAPRMIAELAQSWPVPAAVIVGEPTGMRIADSHKGICVSRTSVTGSAAHSSLVHEGVSAVMVAGELIAHLNRIARDAVRSSTTSAARLQPPYTSISVNMVRGGTALNILAGSCEFFWDIRVVPGESPSQYLAAFDQFARGLVADIVASGRACQIERSTLAEVPALMPDSDGAAMSLARTLLPDGGTPIAVPFATEAGQFQQAGWSTIVCGPGSIEQAHRADEFILPAQLAACDQFLDRSLQRHCAG
jgi:acetylornithine deacetylase